MLQTNRITNYQLLVHMLEKEKNKKSFVTSLINVNLNFHIRNIHVSYIVSVSTDLTYRLYVC